MLQFGLRLGTHPQQCVTTTPRNVKLLKELIERPSSVITTAPTEANQAHLAKSFLEEIRERYAGTRLARQELDGVLLGDAEGTLWPAALIEGARRKVVDGITRVVVAVDPPVTAGAHSDTCGIMVVGARTDGPPGTWEAVVLEDASIQGASPSDWAKAALSAMQRHEADKLIAEVNQGGDLVETVMRQLDPLVPFRKVRASRGKIARAEPVALLYEQGRIAHARGLEELEDQMCQMTAQGFEGKGSPDRVDALVWALTDLILEPAARHRRPQVRSL